jgi:regulator of protease activity HflC (stomatin/prohibitin superfamily)
MKEQTQEEKFIGYLPKIVFAVIVIILLFMAVYTIPAGYRGVVLTFGKPSMEASGEGIHFKIPFVQKVIKMDIKTQKYEADASAASKDLQIVTSKIATNYRINGESTPAIYQEIGVDYQVRVIQPLEQEIVKSITAKFTAEELITRREEVRLDMKAALYERLLPRGIVVEEVSVINFDFSPSFNQAIESKVTAEQLKLKADRDLERIKVEAEQIITQARGQAEAQRLQKSELTPELVRLRELQVQELAIQKWNGILPSVTGSAIPFIGLGSSWGNMSNY